MRGKKTRKKIRLGEKKKKKIGVNNFENERVVCHTVIITHVTISQSPKLHVTHCFESCPSEFYHGLTSNNLKIS